ncbi:MAG: putative hydrolase of the HAD superfamily [Alphaproteobacteria bacterium]|jgi:putative hydrolase of the HAD superfamily
MIVYKALSHIRAISFDLDDTLYDNMPYIYEAERCLSKYINEHYPVASSITPTQWRDIRIASLIEQPELLNDLGLLRATIMTKVFLLAGMPSHLISRAVTNCFDYFYFKRSDFEVPKSVHKVLKKLSKRVPIAAITNGNVNCKAIGIEKYFSCIIHASPSHPMKPAPAMFEHVSASLKIPSKNILHVGDDLDKDIKGATDAGYQTAWLAVNRPMHMSNEDASMLPHVQLSELKDLNKLIKRR